MEERRRDGGSRKKHSISAIGERVTGDTRVARPVVPKEGVN